MPAARHWICLFAGMSLGMCACSGPKQGFTALNQSRDAIRAAQSWQSTTAVQLPGGQWTVVYLYSVDCNGNFDHTYILHDQQNRSGRELKLNGKSYMRLPNNTWVPEPNASLPFAQCGEGPRLIWDGPLYDGLDQIEQNGEIRRGDTTAEDGGCRWWYLSPVKGAPPHYSVCINEQDNLPRQVRSVEHGLNYSYAFSHWNSTVGMAPSNFNAPVY